MTMQRVGGQVVDIECGGIETFRGIQRYVSPNGSAPFDGLTWESAYPLLSDVEADCNPGDLVNIEGGYTYDEIAANGIVWTVDNVRIRSVGELAATIVNTNTGDDGYVFRIICDGCILESLRITKSETTSLRSRAVVYDGASNSRLIRCVEIVPDAPTHIGVHFINGAAACGSISDTPVDAVSFGTIGAGVGTAVYFENAITCFWDNSGAGVVDTIVRFGSSSLLCVVGRGCVLQDGDVGVQLDPGALSNVILSSPLRTTVTEIVDLSGNNTNYVNGELVAHEEVYPQSTGQGDAAPPIVVSNATTDGGGGSRDDQNYWGDVVPLIAPDVVTKYWYAIGLHLYAITAAKTIQIETFFAQASLVSAQNGGNDWDENEVDLTVVDGSLFQDEDFVWVVGDDRTDGEIMIVDGDPVGNVVTVRRETTADGESGLRYNYDVTAVNNRMYVCRRPGLPLYDGFVSGYSADSSKAHLRYVYEVSKNLGANVGWLIRILNEDDDLSASVGVKAIYRD